MSTQPYEIQTPTSSITCEQEREAQSFVFDTFDQNVEVVARLIADARLLKCERDNAADRISELGAQAAQDSLDRQQHDERAVAATLELVGERDQARRDLCASGAEPLTAPDATELDWLAEVTRQATARGWDYLYSEQQDQEPQT